MKKKPFLTLRELVLFGLFPAVIYTSQLLMSVLPNIHLTGMLIMLMTLLFRFKALIPLYVYVLLIGLFNGFNVWWIPYLYIWTVFQKKSRKTGRSFSIPRSALCTDFCTARYTLPPRR